MKFGLREEDLSYIVSALKQFPEIKKAFIFGSRAKGTYKNGSDIDIAILGPAVSFTTVSRLHAMLEDEGPLPYLIDIVDYEHTDNPALKAHIDRVGVLIMETPLSRH